MLARFQALGCPQLAQPCPRPIPPWHYPRFSNHLDPVVLFGDVSQTCWLTEAPQANLSA